MGTPESSSINVLLFIRWNVAVFICFLMAISGFKGMLVDLCFLICCSCYVVWLVHWAYTLHLLCHFIGYRKRLSNLVNVCWLWRIYLIWAGAYIDLYSDGLLIWANQTRRSNDLKKRLYTGCIDADSNHAYSLSANVMGHRYQFGCHINYNEGTLTIACSSAAFLFVGPPKSPFYCVPSGRNAACVKRREKCARKWEGRV